MSKLTVHPLTSDRWPDFVRLFGEQGVGGGCWCMGWRLSRSEYLRQKGEQNKKAMCSLVQNGTIPGIMLYESDEPIGWCAVAPRKVYPALARSPSRRAIDSEPVWSITCVYVKRSHRRQGLSTKLIEAAVAYARSQGGMIVEAYPVPPKPGVSSTNYAFTGFVSSFQEAGFKEHARRSATRPIMRFRTRPLSKRASASATTGRARA